MLELGKYESQGHEMVGMRAAEVVDELVTIGDRGKMIASSALRAGLKRNLITILGNNQQAIEFLQKRIGEGDVVLVKGSHGMNMDLIVSALEGRE